VRGAGQAAGPEKRQQDNEREREADDADGGGIEPDAAAPLIRPGEKAQMSETENENGHRWSGAGASLPRGGRPGVRVARSARKAPGLKDNFRSEMGMV